MTKKLKILVVTPYIEKGISWVGLQGTNDIFEHKYLLIDDGKKHEIVGAYMQMIIKLLIY
ncbi:hypothetical protein [Lactobacillus isalae]|uniref:hypothetical protein n=1 Tax=Lactobacillus isalae TaxID=2993455 RepID=UPI0024A94FFC|nr:hypothetical protein [Lactobacillus isalae]